jgi:hypothetical protein
VPWSLLLQGWRRVGLRSLELLSKLEMRFWIFSELLLLLFRVCKVPSVACLVGEEIDGDPGGISDVVDEFADFGLHGGDCLDAGRAVADYGNLFVGVVVCFVPWVVSLA